MSSGVLSSGMCQVPTSLIMRDSSGSFCPADGNASADALPTIRLVGCPRPCRRPGSDPRSGRTLAHDVARPLVLAQSEEARLTQPAGAGPLGEADLGDEPRLDPVGALRQRLDGLAEGRLVRLERVELLAQVRQRPGVEPGADLAGVAQDAVLVVADEQRAEADARALRLGEAADHDLLLEEALELEPVTRAAGAVRRIGALGDHALPALRARALVRRSRRAVQRLAQREGVARHDDVLERRAPA